MTLTVRALPRKQFTDVRDTIAALRIAVFREWPYLYDGDMAYEKRYLQAYMDNPDAFLLGVFHGADMVGASTASPLASHHEEFSTPMQQAGLDPAQIFYFGESVVLPQWRGQGVGAAFFSMREAQARLTGFSTCLFSAVIRPRNHPLRPADYVPLDAFWQRRGYTCLQGIETTFAWKDIDSDSETMKPMAYWIKRMET